MPYYGWIDIVVTAKRESGVEGGAPTVEFERGCRIEGSQTAEHAADAVRRIVNDFREEQKRIDLTDRWQVAVRHASPERLEAALQILEES